MENENTKMKNIDYSPYDKMPIAVVILKANNILSNTFIIKYVNEAFIAIEKLPKEYFINKNYCDIFSGNNPSWLGVFNETAFKGNEVEINEYSIHSKKYLSITCFQINYGYCCCLIKDTSSQFFLKQTIQKNSLKTDIILKNSVDVVFEIDLLHKILIFDKNTIHRYNTTPVIYNIPNGISEAGYISGHDLPKIKDNIKVIAKTPTTTIFKILARIDTGGDFRWYQVTLTSYPDPFSDTLSVVGFLKNINKEYLHNLQLKQKAEIDGLTQIYNSYQGKCLISKYLNDSKNKNVNQNSTMFIIDIDNFKAINDTYGHFIGDDALIKVATSLKNFFRKDDIIFRLGGDEFAVFVKSSLEDIQIRRICENIFNSSFLLINNDTITVSIGVAVSTSFCYQYEEFYKQADKALYCVKNKGKNNYHIINF